jgi:hypothetical protein
MVNRLSRNTQYDLEIADQCWRTAFLLCRLLDADERSGSGVKLLADAAMNWIHAEKVETRIIGLNLLRFLLKAKLVKNSALQRENILQIFFLSKRSDVRLAALDLLGALGKSPNPVEELPSREVAELRKFSSRMLEALNASQYSYTVKGFRVDVERCMEGTTAYAAMQGIVEGVGVN